MWELFATLGILALNLFSLLSSLVARYSTYQQFIESLNLVCPLLAGLLNVVVPSKGGQIRCLAR